MEKTVYTVFSPCESEKIIEKSRFLTYSSHIESEEQARAFIASIRQKHSLATHVCYAFIADKTGNLQRFSDDGEPQGTAGVPMLEVLKAKKLSETAVAVVRYFGGVKLGAGGLVRAYSSCVADNLDKADVRALCVCVEEKITVDYTGVDALQKYLSAQGVVVLDTEYGERVSVKIAVKKTDEESFIKGLVDYMQGRVAVEKTDEYYFPF